MSRYPKYLSDDWRDIGEYEKVPRYCSWCGEQSMHTVVDDGKATRCAKCQKESEVTP